MKNLSYKIKTSKKAAKEIKKLPREVGVRIIEKLKKAKENPYKYSNKVKGFSNYRKIRVGDYRVIIRVEELDREVLVLYAGHRSTVYEEIERFL